MKFGTHWITNYEIQEQYSDGNLMWEGVCEGEEREINLIPFADVTAAQLFLGIIQTVHIFLVLISSKLAGSQKN